MAECNLSVRIHVVDDVLIDNDLYATRASQQACAAVRAARPPDGASRDADTPQHARRDTKLSWTKRTRSDGLAHARTDRRHCHLTIVRPANEGERYRSGMLRRAPVPCARGHSLPGRGAHRLLAQHVVPRLVAKLAR